MARVTQGTTWNVRFTFPVGDDISTSTFEAIFKKYGSTQITTMTVASGNISVDAPNRAVSLTATDEQTTTWRPGHTTFRLWREYSDGSRKATKPITLIVERQ